MIQILHVAVGFNPKQIHCYWILLLDKCILHVHLAIFFMQVDTCSIVFTNWNSSRTLKTNFG